jgi:hypothetical protein
MLMQRILLIKYGGYAGSKAYEKAAVPTSVELLPSHQFAFWFSRSALLMKTSHNEPDFTISL